MLSIQTYADRTARIMGVVIPDDFKTLFPSLDAEPTDTDRRRINALLAKAPAKPEEKLPEETLTILRDIGKKTEGAGFEAYVRQIRSERDNAITTARDYYRRASERMGIARESEEKIAELKGQIGSRPLAEQVQEILDKTFFTLLMNEVTDNAIMFATPEITLKNPLVGSRPRPMGRFRIRFYPGSVAGALKGLAYAKNNRLVTNSNYIHPFMSSGHPEKDICFGNAQETLDNLLLKREFVQAFHLLQSLLTTYDVNAYPYVKLEDFPTTLGHMCTECNVLKQNCRGCRRCYAKHGECTCQKCTVDCCTAGADYTPSGAGAMCGAHYSLWSTQQDRVGVLADDVATLRGEPTPQAPDNDGEEESDDWLDEEAENEDDV